jgi:hypothetical protein
MCHLIFGVWLDCPCREVIQRSELFAAGDKVFFVDNIHVETWVIIINILINAFFVLNVNFILRIDERLSIGSVLLHQTIKERRRHLFLSIVKVLCSRKWLDH